MADEINASPDAAAESIEKPHYHEVSGTLQVFLGLFTLIFVMILGKCSIPTRPTYLYSCILHSFRTRMDKFKVVCILYYDIYSYI